MNRSPFPFKCDRPRTGAILPQKRHLSRKKRCNFMTIFTISPVCGNLVLSLGFDYNQGIPSFFEVER